MSEPEETVVFEAFVNASDRRPFVQMTCALSGTPVFAIKMPPDIATALGLRAIQAAIESERDAGFISFMLEGLESDDQTASGMLAGLREYRKQFDAQAGTMRPLSDDDSSSLK